MRWTICYLAASLATVFLATEPAGAETMSAGGQFTNATYLQGATSRVEFFQEQPLVGRTVLFDLDLPFGEVNSLVEITESNIGDFGGDWNDVIAWGNLHRVCDCHPSLRWLYNEIPAQLVPEVVSPIGASGPLHAPLFLGDFIVTSLQFNYRVGSSARLAWTVTGDGVVAPEPTTAIMLAGLLVLPLRHGFSKSSTRSLRSSTASFN